MKNAFASLHIMKLQYIIYAYERIGYREKKLCKAQVHALPYHRENGWKKSCEKWFKIIFFTPSPLPLQLALLCKTFIVGFCVYVGRAWRRLRAKSSKRRGEFHHRRHLQLNRSCSCWLLLFFQLHTLYLYEKDGRKTRIFWRIAWKSTRIGEWRRQKGGKWRERGIQFGRKRIWNSNFAATLEFSQSSASVSFNSQYHQHHIVRHTMDKKTRQKRENRA